LIRRQVSQLPDELGVWDCEHVLGIEYAGLEKSRLDGDLESRTPNAGGPRHERHQGAFLNTGWYAQDQTGPDFSCHAEID
jgi:hypothetical protein